MPVRARDVYVIPPYDETIFQFVVWSDLSSAQLSTIDGVLDVQPSSSPGGRIITYDPRYDLDDIIDEIERQSTELGIQDTPQDIKRDTPPPQREVEL